MDQVLSFDDVLIQPGFSTIESRADVSLKTNLNGLTLSLPVISSPMDTVTTPQMCQTLSRNGAIGCLHRFQSIESQIQEFKESDCSPMLAVGLKDWERIDALYDAGGSYFLLDVAHGAQESVVRFVHEFRNKYSTENAWLMVGNFATGTQISHFIDRIGDVSWVNAWRIGIGGGAACSTRVKTGCGLPTLASLISAKRTGVALVADGGIKVSGDVAKSLTIAKAVMVGRMLAGTTETPTFQRNDGAKVKLYRGSASSESYNIQGKVQSYITPEGETYEIPFKGNALNVLKDIEGGLRSALTYIGAEDLEHFRIRAKLVTVTSSGHKESTPHGKL